MAGSLLDRFDENLDRLFDRILHPVERENIPEGVATHKWWVVITSTMTHLVITDQQRLIVIAPTSWNKYIGMNLDVLLSQRHAKAVPIPGPHPEPSS